MIVEALATSLSTILKYALVYSWFAAGELDSVSNRFAF